jgi:hypothetical protein
MVCLASFLDGFKRVNIFYISIEYQKHHFPGLCADERIGIAFWGIGISISGRKKV